MTAQSVCRMAIAIVLLPILAGAQEGRPFEAVEGSPLKVELRLHRIGADGSSQPVPADHRFADGDFFAIELKASRGGYVSLAVEDAKGEDGLRQLWPASGGHPVSAGQPVRLPSQAESPLQLKGKSPTELVVVFSPLPPAGKPQRKWLRQIDLRDVGVADKAPAGPKPFHFTGKVRDDERVKMRIELHHGKAAGRG